MKRRFGPCPRCGHSHYGGEHTVTTRTCAGCGAGFNPKRPKQLYCGYGCARKDHAGWLPRECPQCGAMFSKRTGIYCSLRCSNKSRGHALLTCIRCGAEFKKRRGARYTNEFCSLTCWHEQRREIVYPIPLHHRDMFTGKHKRALLERADHQCEQCGSTEHLEFDHIVPRHLGGKGTLENGQVLCRPCHLDKTANQRPSRTEVMQTD